MFVLLENVFFVLEIYLKPKKIICVNDSRNSSPKLIGKKIKDSLRQH